MSTNAAHQLDDRNDKKRMTWEEIKLAYPDQWVVLEDLDSDPVTLELFSAVVRGRGPTRRDSWRDAALRDDETGTIAHYFTGIPRGPIRRW